METIYLSELDKAGKAILAATFPEYRGRKFEIRIADNVAFMNTMASGGTISKYVVVSLDHGKVARVPQAPFMKDSALHSDSHKLPVGMVVVEHSRFCGTDMGIRFYVHPDQIATSGLLVEPVEVTEDEERVLVTTRSRESSYGGIKDYRFTEARRAWGITREAWDLAKASCIEKKLLNKAGAITPAGRNVASDERLD